MATAKTIDSKKKNEESLFDRVPPQSLEAETAVLGSMLIDNDCIGKIVEILEPACFYKTVHRKIFNAACQLYEKNDPVDLVTMTEALKRQGDLEEIGGSYYLTELAESVPSSANVDHHARIVLERYLLRKLIEEAAGIAKDCYEAKEDPYYILDKSEQRIFGLSD